MHKKTLKIFLPFALCLIITFTASVNTFAAISSTFYTYFIGGSTSFTDFKAAINKNLTNLKNTTTTTASLDLYAEKVSTGSSFTAPNDKKGVSESSSYTIQGICYNTIGSTTYTLISAYNNTGGDSAIFATTNGTSYTKINVSGQTGHFGGIASSGGYTYVACTSYILRISDSDLSTCLSKSTGLTGNNNITSQATLSQISTLKLPSTVTASFLAYETTTDLLWIGGFNESSSAYMYSYNGAAVDSASNNSTLSSYKHRMSIPSCSQGASFRDGKVIITRSYVRTPTSNSYVSEMYCYSSYSTSGTTATLGSVTKKYMLPSMAEGVYLGATYTYIVYESNSSEYYDGILRCTHVLAAQTSSLYS
ncbi:hypothetical protein CLHUN_42100 [Ruminiclostridium hungatei]|uniref:Uncharacterized protein n=1 Tax=Ruminiclostridium hungatei TaxID=48256 RepID=A0A1V4SFA1_RUMHU|nr:hypothetical protein [Ruminiclostridium hungatei]OPX41921.1 hypothetical protein CLHUN_42100 [Ruminiclostridium hungatei]